MLPRPDAPARRLPYTTADMSERLAKRKAEQDAEEFKANALSTLANYKPKEDKPWYKDVAGAIGGAAKTGLGAAAGIVNTAVATPLDIADFGVQQLERLVGVKPTDKFDPASMGSFNLLGETYRGIDKAANYVAGNIAATPGVGKPSSSPFMDTVRSRGWAEALAEPLVHGINVASVAYPASKMAVGAKFPETIANAYRQRLLERDIAAQNNLFPAVQRPANVIDVVEGSRLPARVVEPPATPATRLAQAQTTRALPPASIPKPGMVIPDSLAGIRDLPTLPSRLNFADFQSMPEYQQYLQAGQQLPTAKELADFGFDPERAYMVHSGAGDLTGDVLDPNFTGRANPAVAALNNTQIKNVIAKTTRANAYVDELSKGLEEFNRTGIWNGQQIGNNITNQIKNFGRLDFVDELALNENLTATQLGETNTQRFVERINRVINSQKSYLDTFQQPANLARQGNFLSMYPASVGTHNGYLFGEQPTTYLVGPNTNQITQGLGPGVFEPTAQVNVPEYQVFGQQSPLASINYQPQFRPSLDQMAAARAFFLRKVIEDRMARGLYEPTVAPAAPPASQLALPPAPTAAELARLQREAARAQLGVNIQDIEFPPQNTLITNPDLIDPALEGYEQINPNAWEEIGIAQEKSGFNSKQMPEQMESVRRYFSNEYQTIQSYLSQLSSDPNFMNKADLGFDIRDALQEKGLSRNDFADDMRNLVSNMDQAFEVVPPLTKPVVVYRGVNIAESQDLYAIAFYKNLQPGQIIYDPAFSSTSVDKEMASNWAAQGDDKILIIRVPAGTKAINPISSWTYGYTEMDTHQFAPNEKELLLPRNTIFKVLSNNGKYIELEVVQPGSFKGQGLATNVRNAGQKLSETMSFKEALSKISSEYLQRSIIDKKLAALPQLPNVSREGLMYSASDLVNNKITKLNKETERIFEHLSFSLNNGVLPESINKQILFDTFAEPDRPGITRSDLESQIEVNPTNKLFPKLIKFMDEQQEWMAKNPNQLPQPMFVDWDGNEVRNPIFKASTFTNPYDGFIANGQAFLFKNSDKNRFIENADSYRRRKPDQYINEINNVFDHLAKAEVIGDNNVDDLKKLFRKYFYEKFVDVSG